MPHRYDNPSLSFLLADLLTPDKSNAKDEKPLKDEHGCEASRRREGERGGKVAH